MRAAWRVATPAIAFSFLVNLLVLTGPIYMLQIYDRVLASGSVETLLVLTVLTLLLFAAMALLDFTRGALLARSGDAFDAALVGETFARSLDAARAGGANADQPIKDVRMIRQFLASPALIAAFDAPWTVLFLAVVFMMHALLGVVTLVGVLILVALAIWNEIVSRRATEAAQASAVGADRLNAAALRNVAAADSMGMRAALLARWSLLNDAAGRSALTATDRTGFFGASSRAIRLFLQSAILGAGALLAIRSEITPGVMIAASIIAGRALAPIEVLTSQWRLFTLATISYRRLRAAMGGAGPAATRTELPAPSGALEVSRLFCQPGAAKKPVIKGVSFALPPGEALGIIGPSAAGKSTLARALVGVERAASGEVRLDGANIATMPSDELGRHLGYLPQEVELFAGTVSENIARMALRPPSDQVVAAAQAAGVHAIILSLPDGYDTEIGDYGARLSAGQRQRIGLARALYGDPALVVLDEPNANLDAEGEAALAAAVQRLKARGATTVVVSHRPNAIAFVDKLLLLVDGEARGFGPRDFVLEKLAPKQVAPFRQSGAV